MPHFWALDCLRLRNLLRCPTGPGKPHGLNRTSSDGGVGGRLHAAAQALSGQRRSPFSRFRVAVTLLVVFPLVSCPVPIFLRCCVVAF